MAMTSKKRATDYAWQQRNKKTVTCKLYIQDADDFAAYAAARGKSVNELLKEYISECLGRPLEKRTGPQKKAPAAPGSNEYDDNMPE